jgi:hypothetical protein
MSMLLDLIEVPKSHTGTNLASAFANVLETFRIEKKVRILSLKQIESDTHIKIRFSALQLTTRQITTP